MSNRPYPGSLVSGELILFVISSLVGRSYSYYCDHNFCESGSFCCGDNVCCLYLNDHWTYYFCLTSVAFLLTAFIWIVYHFMYRYDSLFSERTNFLRFF